MIKLVISDDEGNKTSVPLTREEITIGRKEGNTIRLTDRNVSRKHARLAKANGGYVLHDLGSYNGIKLNGNRIEDAKNLKAGDEILIGDYKLAIQDDGTASAGAGSAPTSAATPARAPADTVEAPPAFLATPAPAAPASAPVPSTSNPGGFGNEGTFSGPHPGEVPSYISSMRLVFLAPAGAPPPVTLAKLPMILGRSEAADISLPFSSISREHVRLSFSDGRLTIEDLGSSNGITINGSKHAKTKLSPGDVVKMGVVEFRVAAGGDSTAILQSDLLEGAAAAAKPPSGFPKGIVFGVVGVLLVGIIAVVAMRGGGNATTTPPPIAPPEPAAHQATPTPPGPSSNSNPTPTPPPGPEGTTGGAAAPNDSDMTFNDPASTGSARQRTTGETSARSSSTAGETGRTATGATSGSSTGSHTASSTGSSSTGSSTSSSSTSSSGSSATSGGAPSSSTSTSGGATPTLSPMQQARACGADASCQVRALQGRAHSEPELALLAAAARLSGNSGLARATMQRYLQLYPNGPRANEFRNRLGLPPAG